MPKPTTTTFIQLPETNKAGEFVETLNAIASAHPDHEVVLQEFCGSYIAKAVARPGSGAERLATTIGFAAVVFATILQGLANRWGR